MSKSSTSKASYTPPKGKPTRGRNDDLSERRVFGPTLQWLTLIVVIVLVVAVILIVTNGGDYSDRVNQTHNGTGFILPLLAR